MRTTRTRLALTLATALCLAATGFAQEPNNEESRRKVRTKVAPAYPELARRMNIGGRVRLELLIGPDGRVRSSRVLGGHPLLVKAAQDAVKDWRFVAAPEESTQQVEFIFKAPGS